MNSSTFAGNSDTAAPGLGPVPPPPPPPPVGQVPALKINTAETYGSRRPRPPSDPYEPPAAIQNAMMTKDKKPFTYTPGMGGKLDLSQIRSPRMARRVAKNANDEGIEGPPKSASEPKPTPALGSANLFIQPQVAVPVFPSNIPSPPTANKTPNLQINRVPPAVPERHSSVPEQPRTIIKIETKMTPPPNNSQPNSPETPTSPQITLAKAPTPWLQNKNKLQDELPEWAKRSPVNRSPESSPENTISPPFVQVQPPMPTQQILIQQVPLQQGIPNQQQQFQNRQSQQQFQLPQPVSRPQTQVPIRIEDRPSVFSVKQEPGHHQLQNTQPHHQSRWYQTQQQPVAQNQVHSSPVRQEQSGYIIPIMVEGANNRLSNGPPTPTSPSTGLSQPQIRIITTENQTPKIQNRGPVIVPITVQSEPGPVQSRSFRVLQKITDTDADDVDGDQLRKLQLTEDDKVLMNKFKEQVDGDTYLHQEADPRYRGSAIPSRAFRYLQNMTDSGDVTTAAAPRAVNSAIKIQNRNSKSFDEIQANLPASEQTVQEPKKYTGSAIPSRSFRILQAMTAPENIATQENRQADFVCQTENNIPGNQQGAFYPLCPPAYWSPDGWWSYYPLPPTTSNSNSENQSYEPYTFYNYEDGNTYVCYPIYSQNYRPFVLSETGIQLPFPEPTNKNSREEESAITGNRPNPKSEWEIHLNNPETTVSVEDENLNVDETRIIVTPCTDDDTDSESCEEPSKSSKCSEKADTISSSTSSDDSESYLAYSTGLNQKNNYQKSFSAATISEDTCGHSCVDFSEDKLNSDSDSDDEDEEYKVQPLEIDAGVQNQLIVICEDTNKNQKTVPEEPDEPPDENTVSVRLPLRFKFSVSKNNQDVTTVIVGNSTIKSEKLLSNDSDESEMHVDFTLKQKISKESTPEPEVDFTFRKDLGQVKKVECNENVETEFTVGDTKTDVIRHFRRRESDYQSSNSDEETMRNSSSNESRDGRLTDPSDLFYESLVSDVCDLEISDQIYDTEVTSKEEEMRDLSFPNENEDAGGNSSCNKSKNLLSVQNSREETDDEDSGVTSDMSRMISEVDTDSECCATTKKQSKYQRTQTHSRLFRLLNDDSISTKEDQEDRATSRRRDHLNLPLTSNIFNSEDQYCSSYSSGMTSPEYSPVHEKSWRRLHEENNGDFSLEETAPLSHPEKSTHDCYYQTWKTPKLESELEILPSMAHKVLESKKPHWAYRVNVLCPRIRSSKNVPKDFKSSFAKSIGPSNLSFPKNPVRNSHC
ncbi:uncharacterized protein LOC117173220 isoform X2 [Belonocnema kinseyi]|uniref:uncharacterized protein LOC117173220 isoform X2 n=1 Tax=Belonocnema kinseyi TaxID=2817044 RepID=UPI00143D378F|nr:uncharacterized protein LOC117173220 isoform X2 [Belonocnema kinseyi]